VTAADVRDAVAVLRRGGLIGFPTETVYGLGADASNEAAVHRVFSVKGRPVDHPLIVHVASADALAHWAAAVPETAARLAEAFWPGPLTLLVPRASHVLDVVTGGRSTVGVRVPSHPIAQDVLRHFGGGIAAPSANRFGRVSPTTALHVRRDLGDDVDLVLDGGESAVGLESTIVDCSGEVPMILRPGAITAEMLSVVVDLQEASGPSRAPGMLASHYAPRCHVLLVASASEAHAVDATGRVEIVDPGPNLAVYAHNLYRWLREADERQVETLVIVLPPDEGLGRAIRDRLQKASVRPEDHRGD
jgi:L-threonylcarbamoyladenylate synthase